MLSWTSMHRLVCLWTQNMGSHACCRHRMFLCVCVPHVRALYTSLHTGYVNSVYKLVLFVDNIHVYAQYMYILYAVTGVLHVCPATLQSSFAHGVSV